MARLVRFGCVTLCHLICFVQVRVDVCKICQLLFHYILHEHVFQHHLLHSSQSTSGCPCFCRLTVDMVNENHLSQLFQEMFCHPFGNSSCQGIQFCLSRTQAHCLVCMLRVTARQAWQRWAILLACSAAKAFGLSLERRGGLGSDGFTPPTTEVISDHRHLPFPV